MSTTARPQQPQPRMTVEEFLAWTEQQPDRPRYELIDGFPVAMAPERVRHNIVKAQVHRALGNAVRAADLHCMVFTDGMAVKIDAHTTYEPDAQVYCGERLQGDDLLVPAPVVIVEVLSPSTGHVDAGTKLSGYFQLASVRHYLIVDPVRKNIIHHERGADGIITTHIVRDGLVRMAPPGIEIALTEVFAEL